MAVRDSKDRDIGPFVVGGQGWSCFVQSAAAGTDRLSRRAHPATTAQGFGTGCVRCGSAGAAGARQATDATNAPTAPNSGTFTLRSLECDFGMRGLGAIEERLRYAPQVKVEGG